jgi:putative endonuclease
MPRPATKTFSPVQTGSEQSTPDTGVLGEDLIARWLQSQGWEILQRRWRCRWGELDLIVARRSPTTRTLLSLAFVEVKTRRPNNWDENGALALQLHKQTKLWKAAQLFLTAHPELADLPCQFDVALVTCERLTKKVDLAEVDGKTVAIASGHRLSLHNYLPAAFMTE